MTDKWQRPFRLGWKRLGSPVLHCSAPRFATRQVTRRARRGRESPCPQEPSAPVRRCGRARLHEPFSDLFPRARPVRSAGRSAKQAERAARRKQQMQNGPLKAEFTRGETAHEARKRFGCPGVRPAASQALFQALWEPLAPRLGPSRGAKNGFALALGQGFSALRRLSPPGSC